MKYFEIDQENLNENQGQKISMKKSFPVVSVINAVLIIMHNRFP